MTSLSLNNGPVAASQGSTIAVYPVSMHFMDGQCFCQELGGHLASITDEIDFQALQTATRSSGVKSAVFIGAHEISEGQWMFTDGTQANFGLLESHGWCTQSKQGGEHLPNVSDRWVAFVTHLGAAGCRPGRLRLREELRQLPAQRGHDGLVQRGLHHAPRLGWPHAPGPGLTYIQP